MSLPALQPDPRTEETLPPLQTYDGRVCVTCGKLYPRREVEEGSLERCPRDQGRLVLASEYAGTRSDSLVGSRIAERFTLKSLLGAGSMGAVYRASQDAIGRDVAVKILRSEKAFDTAAKARFEREARANSVLASPHTVTVYDFGQAKDGSLFLAMELLEGESLGGRMRRVRRLPPGEAIRIARHALASLAEAHSKGIIHRDIKPDNLFLVKDGQEAGGEGGEICKVLDFGIAKVVRGEAGMDALETQAGMVFGTPRYMSPEQAQGKTLDARSDLYSLGVILYQMLAGQPPFTDEDAVLVMAQHIREKPPAFAVSAPQAQVPPALEKVVLKALAKRPADRPKDAEEFRRLLEEATLLLDEPPPSSLLPPLSSLNGSSLPKGVWVGLPLAFVAILLLVAFRWPQGDGPKATSLTADPGSSSSTKASPKTPQPSPKPAVSKATVSPEDLPNSAAAASASNKPKPAPAKPNVVKKRKGRPPARPAAPATTSKYGRFQ